MMIERCRRWSVVAVFCRMNEVHHLTRSHEMNAKAGMLGAELLKLAVKPAHCLSQKHLKIGLNAAVTVQLDENPRRPIEDARRVLEPELEALQ